MDETLTDRVAAASQRRKLERQFPMHPGARHTDDTSWWDTQATRRGVFGGDLTNTEYELLTRSQASYIVSQLDLVRSDPRVLDVGCGVGRLLAPARDLLPQATLHGIDPSHVMLSEAWAYMNDDVVYLSTVFNSATRFDGAWCVLVMQHLDDDAALLLLMQTARQLKQGARLVSQWQIGDPAAVKPMQHPRTVDQITQWLTLVGLDTVSVVADRHVTGYSDEWVWVTAERTGEQQ